jgi:LPS-assembly lipoprotein
MRGLRALPTQQTIDMQRRTLLTLVPAAVLVGCGFRLRGVPEFGFSSLYIAAPTGSSLARELQRTLDGAGSELKVLRNAADLPTAQVVIDILSEQRDRVVVGQNASGQVREVQLRLKVKFRLRTQGSVELIPETEIQQQRDMTYSETQALSKEAEEALLYRNMQTDIVQQLLRRLSVAKLPQ